jgi:hypothetical protein
MRDRGPRRRGIAAITGRFGELPGGYGVAAVFGSAALGALLTIALQRDPGTLLGMFIVIGTVIAGLGVRARSVYLIIPVPVLAYSVTAVVAGMINDRAADTSHFADLVHLGSWIGNGFLTMSAATIIAIITTGVRMFAEWRSGRLRPPGRPSRPGGSPRGPSRPSADETGPYRPVQPDLDGQTGPLRPQYRPHGAPTSYGPPPGSYGPGARGSNQRGSGTYPRQLPPGSAT